MLNRIFDQYFWFIQPSSVLSHADYLFGYISLGLVVLAIVFRVLASLFKNEIDRKLFRKIWRLMITTGIIGLFWYGLRYENTFIFADRYWIGINLIVGVIWLLFILKYLIFNYYPEKLQYDREVLKNKYLPKSR